MRYYPGDRVIVRSDLSEDESYYMDDGVEYNCATQSMIALGGSVVTIRKSTYFGQYEIEESDCFWTDGMFVGLADDDISYEPPDLNGSFLED